MSHALLSPSSAHRWLKCPGSIRLSASIPDIPSAASEEGTLAHELGEAALNGGIDTRDVPGDYPEEMLLHVQSYVDYVRKLEGRLFVEVKIKMDEWIPGGYGTADAVVLGEDVLDVVDLKYGMREVKADDNPQLRLYGAGAVAKVKGIKKVRLHIVQPRIGNYDMVEVSTKKLLKWAETVKPAAAACMDDEAPLVPSEDACRWCPAAPTCPALNQHMLEVVGGDFEVLPEVSELTPQQLAFVVSNNDLVVAWLKRVCEHVQERMQAGEAFEGLKLVEARTVRRFNDKAEKVLKKLLGDAAFRAPPLITLGEAERLIGKKKFSELGITTKPEGKPVVVPDTDSRPAITTTAEDFSKH